jgi:hypothetical protein
LELTSFEVHGTVNSDDSESSALRFFKNNGFSASRVQFLIRLFQEARENKFTVRIKQAT